MSEKIPYDLSPGDLVNITSENANRNVLLRFADGTEVEMKIGPNDHIRLKIGETPCNVVLTEMDENTEGLKVVRD